MRKPLTLAALLAILFFLTDLSSAQDTPSYRAGLKSIAIPAPSSDLVETGPDYRVLLEPLSPVNNRLIAGFIQPADLDSIRSGGKAPLNRYALVEVLRRAEFSDVSPDDFKQVADSVGTQFGAALNSSLKDQQDEINRRIKALGSASTGVTLDKPIELGAFFNKPDACSYGMIMPLTANGTSTKMVMGMIVMRVQSRILFLYTYAEFKDDSTVQWVRTTDEHWADAILQANK